MRTASTPLDRGDRLRIGLLWHSQKLAVPQVAGLIGVHLEHRE